MSTSTADLAERERALIERREEAAAAVADLAGRLSSIGAVQHDHLVAGRFADADAAAAEAIALRPQLADAQATHAALVQAGQAVSAQRQEAEQLAELAVVTDTRDKARAEADRLLTVVTPAAFAAARDALVTAQRAESMALDAGRRARELRIALGQEGNGLVYVPTPVADAISQNAAWIALVHQGTV